ncbi:hypothetical protein HLB44_02285 [Aquincola sp. S2]|uniref:Uncharacterized protein n=1 Tax=Pseudaquabacterium terrae TaxID=2732868 RepID=A0ABX2ED33_9BURK|nr:hypothetical protein [Aquabacterium terrae]NRF65807.1 hypothetical protein [Aquabacterium terrae]
MISVSANAPLSIHTPMEGAGPTHAPAEPVALAQAAPAGEGFASLPRHDMHPDVVLYADKSRGAARAQLTKTPPPAPPPPKVYDLATVSQAEIDALKKSGDLKQKRLGWTIENAKVAYGDLLVPNAQGHKAHIVVTSSDANGGQPVLVMKGPGFKDTLPARVHTHYHGDNATVADPVGSKAGTNSRMRASMARDPQTVFVLPEANNTTQATDSPARDNSNPNVSWAGIKSQVQTTQDGLTAAGITTVGKQIVSVHSKGGSALSTLLALDPSGKLLKADRLEMYDSLYGSQGPVARWAATANGKAVQEVIVYRGNLAPWREDGIKQAFGKKFEVVVMRDQPALNDPKNSAYRDSVNPITPDATGATHDRNRDYTDKKGVYHVHRPTVRQFDEDPHYRTTGQFLDTKPGP